MPRHNSKGLHIIIPINAEGAEAMRADRHSWLERRAALGAVPDLCAAFDNIGY